MNQEVNIQNAASHLGVSTDTIRRRLRRGILKGRREARPQGYQWLVELPEEACAVLGPVSHDMEVRRLEDAVAQLRESLNMAQTELAARRQEVQQLLDILQQRGLPEGRPS